LAWKASPTLDISAKFQRKVLQLNFGDFLASVDVRNNNNNAGNFDLVPPQSWLLNLEANRSLGKAGSIKLKVDLESISDLVDRIPITATTEAPGNIDGTAKRLRTEINASFCSTPSVSKGAKLDLIGAWQTASLRDPLTGEKRPISNRGRTYWNLDFRHDIPNSQLGLWRICRG
jgi:outer membrane receptor for ferrienterochelin and colicins